MTLAALRADALACHAAALAAVEPGRLLRARLQRSRDALALVDDAGTRAEHRGPVLIVGAGKAGLAMARAAADVAGPACAGGVVVVPHGGEGPCAGGIDVVGGGHPLPDADGARATERLLAAVARADATTLVLVVLSGGASALLVAPADGVTLADKAAVSRALLARGADIRAFNTVRKHCSRVKGGGLARTAARAAALWALVLSDVVGDDLATIASGPTVADPTTYADAARVIAEHLAAEDVPAAVREHVARGAAGLVPETLKPGDAALARAVTVLVGGNRDARAAAASAAAARGYVVEHVDVPVAGDAAAAGRMLATRLLAAPAAARVAVVAGGEPTVRVVAGGRGGRAQQLALAAAEVLAGADAALLAAGTDGVDGPTDAAGACVDGETVARASRCGLSVARALAATDSHPVLAATNDLVCTGPTGTNVADVVVALRGAC